MGLPLWKLRREVRRLGGQIRQWPGDLINFLFATRHYDARVAGSVRRYEGCRPASSRVVIFLIFPSRGLLASHLRTLAYFCRKGYAPLVVTNVPLTESDRGRLLEHCWSCMERPNFGYDFGGYRDAVLSLADELPTLERLVLINDSTWFPLPGGHDWLDEVEALGVDFAGAASNFGTPRPEIEDFRSIRWTYSPNHRNFHYCSFALCLRPAVLRHPRFLDFWRRLRLTDKKKRTVRRGEIGFTQWALAEGLSHGATLDVTALDRDLELLTDARLLEIARGLIIPEQPKLQTLWRQIVAEAEPRRPDLIKLILLAVSRQGSSYALAAYATRERGFPFLKKSPVWLNPDSCANTLRLLERMNDTADMLAEARALAAGKTSA
jgi:hypothetical protein